MSLVEHYDQGFARIVDSFRVISDEAERMMMLIEFASCYVDPPTSTAHKPYSGECRLPISHEDIYFWAIPRADGRLEFSFAVRDKEGVSVKAFAAMLSRTLSGADLKQVASISPQVIDIIFGPSLTHEKRQSLLAMLEAVRSAAVDMLEEEL